jgi:hypothetical protein
MARDVFRESLSPSLNFAAKSSLDGCDSMLQDDWLDIPCVVILRSFCFKPTMVSDKNIQRNILPIIFLCSFHKGITTKDENSCYLLEVLVLGQKACPWETFKLLFKLVKWFPLQHHLYVSISRFMPTHNEISNIYDKQIRLQPPFQKFYEQEV